MVNYRRKITFLLHFFTSIISRTKTFELNHLKNTFIVEFKLFNRLKTLKFGLVISRHKIILKKCFLNVCKSY